MSNLIKKINETLPKEIFDLINREMVNTIEFLEDPDNIIFLIEDNIVGMSKYFYPFKDDMIIFNCKQDGFEYIGNKYQNEQQYINMEKIGIILEPPNKNIGVIIKKELLEQQLNETQVIKLIPKEPRNEIYNATTLAYLKNPRAHGAVGALHCQNGYFGREYLPINYLEYEMEDYEDWEEKSRNLMEQRKVYIKSPSLTIKLPYNVNFTSFTDRYNNITDEQINIIEYIINNPDNYFSLNQTEREYLTKIGYVNPLRYPAQYYQVYKEEKEYRNLEKLDNLIKLKNPRVNFSLLNDNDKQNVFVGVIHNEISSTKLKYAKTVYNTINTLFLKEYSDNLVIAGGFALALYQNNKTDLFDDVDIFIHSCSEDKAKQIILEILDRINAEFYFSKTIDSENAFSIIFGLKENYNKIKLQFIKRIYSSPSEIIHGFDIDCSCILIYKNNFYATKRGYYSIFNNVNIINFEKLSPSYEYRLVKYCRRGFGIYIPQIKYFKDNFNFDINNLQIFGGDVINTLILTNMKEPKLYISDYHNKVDSYDNINDIKDLIEDFNFNITNPSDQSSSTFNSIVLEDNIKWYPNKNKNKINLPSISNELIEIEKNVTQIEKNASNLFSSKRNIYPIITKKLEKYRKLYYEDPKDYYRDIIDQLISQINLKYDDAIVNLLKLFSGKVVASGNCVLGSLTNINYYNGIDLYLMNVDEKYIDMYISMISGGFKNYFASTYLGLDNKDINCYTLDIKKEKDYIQIEYDFDYEIGERYGIDEYKKIPTIKIYTKSFSSYEEIFSNYILHIQQIILTSDNKYYTTKYNKYCLENKLIPTLSYLKINDIYYKYGYKQLSLGFNKDELFDDLFKINHIRVSEEDEVNEEDEDDTGDEDTGYEENEEDTGYEENEEDTGDEDEVNPFSSPTNNPFSSPTNNPFSFSRNLN